MMRKILILFIALYTIGVLYDNDIIPHTYDLKNKDNSSTEKSQGIQPTPTATPARASTNPVLPLRSSGPSAPDTTISRPSPTPAVTAENGNSGNYYAQLDKLDQLAQLVTEHIKHELRQEKERHAERSIPNYEYWQSVKGHEYVRKVTETEDKLVLQVEYYQNQNNEFKRYYIEATFTKAENGEWMYEKFDWKGLYGS
ncbi:MAG: hypothetical protein ACLFQ6_06785 [Candidatus Sumerlaeia bacterium]